MGRAEDAFYQMSAAQQREILTATVLTVLGPIVRSHIAEMISAMKRIISEEVRSLQLKKERSPDQEKLLAHLLAVTKIPASLDGIKQFEQMLNNAENVPGSLNIAKKCFDALPGVLRFEGFGSLIKHRALSKFISFASSWRYSGKGYEPPAGMSEPFSGYDEIIHSLVGHPICMEESRRQAKLWEKAHGK